MQWTWSSQLSLRSEGRYSIVGSSAVVKYFLVDDLILPGDPKNFAEKSEVECVQSSSLSGICRPCLTPI